MKKVFALIFLAAVGYGSFYAYTHKAGVKKILAEIQQGIDEGKEEDANKGRSKTPKTLKPDEYAALDSFATNAPKEKAKNVKTLVHYLIQPARTDREKARVLFTWVATHISYNAEGYNKKDYGDNSTEGTLQSGKSVCEGYGNLLKDLCSAAGLEAVKISGYAKGYGYTPGDTLKESDHAWNAIKLDGKWHLFDPTWAAGYGENVNGEMKAVTRFDPYWFDVDPKAFIFTHLPEQEKWQLNSTTITLNQYQAMPQLMDNFFKLGFDADKVFNDAVAGKPLDYYVETYDFKFPVVALQAPEARALPTGQEVTFSFKSDYAEKIALIDGNDWSYFKKDGNTFTLSHTPEKDSILIAVKVNWYEKNYQTIMKYSMHNASKAMAVK